MISNLLIGLVSGVVSAGLWTLIVWMWLKNRDQRQFGQLTGRYRVRAKFVGQSPVPVETFVFVEAQGNVLHTRSEQQAPDNSWSGEVAMSQVFPKSGAGYYQHMRAGAQLWGLHQVQVKSDREILVHTIYSHSDHRMIMKGYIWEKV